MDYTSLYRGKRHYEFNGCWLCAARPYSHESRERSDSGLSNHLGNVQVVVSDKRISVCDEELEVEYFKADVLAAMDYYPFGMLSKTPPPGDQDTLLRNPDRSASEVSGMMPDRQWYANSDSSAYRFGFNGMERDNEVSGQGNSLDFGARIYDARLGRWLSRDPMHESYPEASPYSFASANPIYFIDAAGERPIPSKAILDRTKPHIKYEYRIQVINGNVVYQRRAHYYNVRSLPSADSRKVQWQPISATTYHQGKKWQYVDEGPPGPIIIDINHDGGSYANNGASTSDVVNVGENNELSITITYDMYDQADNLIVEYFDEESSTWISVGSTGLVKNDGTLTIETKVPEGANIRVRVEQEGGADDPVSNYKYSVHIEASGSRSNPSQSDTWVDNWSNDRQFDPLQIDCNTRSKSEQVLNGCAGVTDHQNSLTEEEIAEAQTESQ